jgi:hypothetical protein
VQASASHQHITMHHSDAGDNLSAHVPSAQSQYQVASNGLEHVKKHICSLSSTSQNVVKKDLNKI